MKKKTFSGQIELSDCRLDFYHNKKRISSCQDLKNSNLTTVRSIFQIDEGLSRFVLKGVEYKHPICPLMFSDAFFYLLNIDNIADTFYKKNVIKFSNETFDDLNLGVYYLVLNNVININLDSSIVHPSVFHKTKDIFIGIGSLNSIEGEIFRNISEFISLSISSTILRNINHKQGIEWIRNINHGINVNLSNLTGFNNDSSSHFNIILITPWNQQRKRLSKSFPDEDFCIYRDFPFTQFLVVIEFLNHQNNSNFKSELTCTYLWLVQYYESYYKFYLSLDFKETVDLFEGFFNATGDFRGMISNCDFETRIRLCNKSNYKIMNIWDESDFFILNKKIQIAFQISLYPISLFGLVTNFIVVIVILKKENGELFKEFKQYTYL